ncbi:hypothetical protein LNL84_12215 [Vibrio sp. ZSDZ34]|uniref:Uncharacterized protein n=1 Tax=Vibrio gelatinilyticus TaxID=2893468 RepID=A0A9X1WAY7_9VIBR|nr:hypothetical protein [Vibrio gelatinilyticus]MCJ2377597.1 hypothetical protein [Vibrio gelatinilyticus]
MLLRSFSVILISLLFSGCSSYQMNQIGLRSSSINSYPNHMSDVELCEASNGYRPTNQTHIALQGERWRRKLSPEQCEEVVKELYLSVAMRHIFDK